MRLFAAIVLALGGSAAQASLVDKPLVATEHIIYAPAGPLISPSDASEKGLLSRIARVAGVPFGFESDDRAPRPSTTVPVEPHYISASTLRAALDEFVRLDPRYEWRELGGVFVVRPISAWNDPSNALNRPAADIDWHTLNVVSGFDRVAHLLYPDETSDVFAGLNGGGDRTFDVKVTGGTILDVLNAVARADGELGWSVRYGRPSDPVAFELTIGHYGIGPMHGWLKRPTVGQR